MRDFITLSFVVFCFIQGGVARTSFAANMAEKICISDLDSLRSKKIEEIAELTLIYETARRSDTTIHRIAIENLYETAYSELTHGLLPNQMKILDARIKAEIERIQRRENVQIRADKNQEKVKRDAEEDLIYGPTFALYEELAIKAGIPSENFRAMFNFNTLNSFQFRSLTFPRGGKTMLLGSPESERHRADDERIYEVTLNEPFEMQATPVTQIQWSLVMGENPSKFKAEGIVVQLNGHPIEHSPNRPVEKVSWENVQRYIAKLNRLDPTYTYRLPTEAEWEYAARAGSDTAYSFGNDASELGKYAWYDRNSASQTHDVASLLPNGNGLYDMNGNVWQWVQDWYIKFRQPNASPAGPTSGWQRVYRGGGYSSSEQFLRSSTRNYHDADFTWSGLGFRLVRTPKGSIL